MSLRRPGIPPRACIRNGVGGHHPPAGRRPNVLRQLAAPFLFALTLAVLSAIANFLFIPYYPFWALLLITLDVFVIWAITAHGGELRDRV